jgi:hypothetical protein
MKVISALYRNIDPPSVGGQGNSNHGNILDSERNLWTFSWGDQGEPLKGKFLVGYKQTESHKGKWIVDMKYNGLYFCATTMWNNSFPPSSPYGRYRLIAPVTEFDWANSSIFFLDYYNYSTDQVSRI